MREWNRGRLSAGSLSVKIWDRSSEEGQMLNQGKRKFEFIVTRIDKSRSVIRALKELFHALGGPLFVTQKFESLKKLN